MEMWRSGMVQAWIEVSLGMPQYGSRCADNIKSGKVLLELSDSELESELGITHPLHRKKLRLAIEEHRNPALVRFPCIAELSHVWVSSEWLPDIGLPQVLFCIISLRSFLFSSSFLFSRSKVQNFQSHLNKIFTYLGGYRKSLTRFVFSIAFSMPNTLLDVLLMLVSWIISAKRT